MADLSDNDLMVRVAAWERNGRKIKPTAEMLGVTRSTISRSIANAKIRGLVKDTPDEIQMPDFPDEDVGIDEIIDSLSARFDKRKASYDAHAFFPVKVTTDLPIGILWFGDPHCDDDGCNWTVLRDHCRACRDTPGLYGANIGDTTNNWAGRLAHLYANQETSKKTAQRLASWFMLESGVQWLIWLIGNHDAWGDGAAVLAAMARQHGTQKIVCHDWEARFKLKFSNGWEPRIFASHDFSGYSQWNPLHGPMKEGQMGQSADLYVCGHRHNWAAFAFENPAKGSAQTFIRVRGYKFLDEYARRIGKVEQQTGSGIMTIFDPRDKSIVYFENIVKGAEFLTSLRGGK